MNNLKNVSFEQNVFSKIKNKNTAVQNPQTKPQNTFKKIAIAGAVIGGVAIAGLLLSKVTKGKFGKPSFDKEIEERLQKLIEEKQIDKETVDFLKDVVLNRKIKNPKELYNAMLTYMGHKTGPNLVQNKTPKGANGVYLFTSGELSIEGKVTMGTMYHELTHFDQFQKVYRAFGKDKMIDAYCEKINNHMKYEPKYAQIKLGKSYNEATEKEIEEVLTKERQRISEKFNEEFYEKIAKEKGELSEKEFKQAETYLEAMKNPFHNQSYIEKEAYSKELQFGKKIQTFINAIK